jgi:large subunit ribosomal protein L21
MYAVIKTGGKQYRVAQGDEVNLEKLIGEPGDAVQFDQVLLVGSDDSTAVGTPLVAGAQVTGTIVRQGRGSKLVVFKFRRRKDSRSRNGHRQAVTRVRIDAIQAS